MLFHENTQIYTQMTILAKLLSGKMRVAEFNYSQFACRIIHKLFCILTVQKHFEIETALCALYKA